MIRPSSSDSITPNSVASCSRDRDGGDGDAGAGLHVLLDHLARVHAVDVVGAEHADDVGRSSVIRLRFW